MNIKKFIKLLKSEYCREEVLMELIKCYINVKLKNTIVKISEYYEDEGNFEYLLYEEISFKEQKELINFIQKKFGFEIEFEDNRSIIVYYVSDFFDVK